MSGFRVKHEAPKNKTHANFVGAGDSLQVQEVPYTHLLSRSKVLAIVKESYLLDLKRP